jgi:hypothetical protein
MHTTTQREAICQTVNDVIKRQTHLHTHGTTTSESAWTVLKLKNSVKTLKSAKRLSVELLSEETETTTTIGVYNAYHND